MKVLRLAFFLLVVAVQSAVLLYLWLGSAASEMAWTWINEQYFAGANPDRASDIEFLAAALLASMLSWAGARVIESWLRAGWAERSRR